MSEELVGAAAITCRYAVAFILVTAALPKLLARDEFQRAVANYALLPRRLVGPVAAWLPRLELACAVLLLLGIGVTPVSALASALLVVFALAVALNLARGRRISCGCFSTVAPRTIGWGLVAGDLLLAGMAAAVAVTDPGVLTLGERGGASAAALSAQDAVAALVLAGTLVLAYLLVASWGSVSSASRGFAASEGNAT